MGGEEGAEERADERSKGRPRARGFSMMASSSSWSWVAGWLMLVGENGDHELGAGGFGLARLAKYSNEVGQRLQ